MIAGYFYRGLAAFVPIDEAKRPTSADGLRGISGG